MASQTRLAPTALIKLAERKPETWSWPKTGKPHITQIARDAGISRVTLHRMIRGDWAPSRTTEDRLRDLAVSTGLSHNHAQKMLFEVVDLDESAA